MTLINQSLFNDCVSAWLFKLDKFIRTENKLKNNSKLFNLINKIQNIILLLQDQ